MFLLGGFALLGLGAGALIFLLTRRRPATPALTGLEADVEAVVSEARRRLASTRRGRRGDPRELFLMLVLGPAGSTKTTTVVESGLDPELLAGEVHRSGSVVPTSAVNLWYGPDLVVAEAGGAVLDDPAAWARFVRHMRPARWAAALLRRPQAPRVAVVCFPSEALAQPGAAQEVTAAARALRSRLLELAQGLGIRLPVYVLFTRADRIPYFEDFVRNLSRDEAQQVFGTTLAVRDDAEPGVYAERESGRIAGAFDEIFRSLALRRPDVLRREARESSRAGAYEFPREVRKLSDAATRFLVELGRPSPLAVSPLVRGFYFTGVRPVVVDEAARVPAPGRATPQIALGATSVFSLQQLQQEQSSAPLPSGSRRVPEWVFLKPVFRDIVLKDRIAREVTSSGVRVNVVRRSLLAAACAAALILSIGFTVSFVNNRALQRDAIASARGVENLVYGDLEAPSLATLQRLDALREQTQRIAAAERGRRPWRLRWGLYTGSEALPHLRQLYFDRFDRLLWGSTRDALIAALAAPVTAAEGTADYTSIYDRLKAHLVTTVHPEESTAEFLAPVLLGHWGPAEGLDAERRELAERQFAFFASELPHGNPYRDPPREALVSQTRLFLSRLDDQDALYQILLADAARTLEPVRFDRVYPAARSVVLNEFEVPGAFTGPGWATVHASLADLDNLVERELWVVGERTRSRAERAALAQQLRERYTRDYIDHWRRYLESSRVVTGGSIAQIAQRLDALSSNQPPLMQLFSVASHHTAVDTAVSGPISSAFQPLHRVFPPATTGRFIDDANAGYVQAIGSLRDALAQAALLEHAEPDIAAVEQVNAAVRGIAADFVLQGTAGEVGRLVQRLLEAPLGGLQAAVGQLPILAVNEAGQDFCNEFGRVLAKYPFNAAGAPATADELSQAFQPRSSMLWAFIEGPMAELLAPRGNQFGPRSGARPRPSPAFVNFINGAVGVSRALFDVSGAGPEVAFMFRPQTTAAVDEIVVSMDGQTQTFTRTDAAAKPLVWRAERASGIEIVGRADGVEVFRIERPTMWGVFRLFDAASWSGAEGSRHSVQWRLPGLTQPLVADITFARGVPIFHPQRVRLRCVARVAS